MPSRGSSPMPAEVDLYISNGEHSVQAVICTRQTVCYCMHESQPCKQGENVCCNGRHSRTTPYTVGLIYYAYYALQVDAPLPIDLCAMTCSLVLCISDETLRRHERTGRVLKFTDAQSDRLHSLLGSHNFTSKECMDGTPGFL